MKIEEHIPLNEVLRCPDDVLARAALEANGMVPVMVRIKQQGFRKPGGGPWMKRWRLTLQNDNVSDHRGHCIAEALSLSGAEHEKPFKDWHNGDEVYIDPKHLPRWLLPDHLRKDREKEGYCIVRIPKKSGGFRTIYAPNRKKKEELRRQLQSINDIQNNLMRHNRMVHGFREGHSPVTNALLHVDKPWTLNVDLSDFFDTVTRDHLKDKVPSDLLEDTLVDGATRQGLPTSPALANIGAMELDQAIRGRIPQYVRYTRYADDLSFSSKWKGTLTNIMKWLPGLVEDHGFKLNPKKTRIQSAKFGRRIVTGVSVGGHDVRPTRKARRKMRAILHQKGPDSPEAQGMAQWFNSIEGVRG